MKARPPIGRYTLEGCQFPVELHRSRDVHDHRTRLADQFGANLIAEDRIDIDLNGYELLGIRFKHHDDRATRRIGCAAPGLKHGNRREFGSKDITHDIKFMRRGIGDCHLSGEARRRLHVAVKIVHHHRPSQCSVRHRRLHPCVWRIKAPHVADVHQPPAQFGLGVQNAQPLRGILRERLFAEDRLSHRQGSKDQRNMGFVRARNHHRIHIPPCDHPFWVRGGVLGTAAVRHHARPLPVGIANHLQNCAGNVLGKDAGVVRPHHAAAYQRNPDRHFNLLSVHGSPQLFAPRRAGSLRSSRERRTDQSCNELNVGALFWRVWAPWRCAACHHS